jgi:hypothetical protein
VWNERFKDHLFDRLNALGHAEVASIDWWDGPDSGQRNIRVTCTDGRAYHLMVVNASRPGGEDHSKPEVIVQKQGAPTA